jgi:hypothetical protein
MSDREHLDLGCWCDPLYMRQCPEGEGDCLSSCWQCKGAAYLRCEASHPEAEVIHIEVEWIEPDEPSLN